MSRYFHIGDLVRISSSAAEKYRYSGLVEHTGIVIDTIEEILGIKQVKVMWTAASDEGWHPALTLEIVSRLPGIGNSTVDPHK